MKRITFVVDCRDEEVQKVRMKIESFLKSVGQSSMIIGMDELVSSDE